MWGFRLRVTGLFLVVRASEGSPREIESMRGQSMDDGIGAVHVSECKASASNSKSVSLGNKSALPKVPS